jgi:hypothetical protein
MSDEIECQPLGKPVQDLDGRKFYTAVEVHNLTVCVGSCARVRTEVDLEQSGGDASDYSYGQVLAIYDDPDPDVGVMAEIRWFYTPQDIQSELCDKKRMSVLDRICHLCITLCSP